MPDASGAFKGISLGGKAAQAMDRIFNPEAAGRRAVRKHGDALVALAGGRPGAPEAHVAVEPAEAATPVPPLEPAPAVRH